MTRIMPFTKQWGKRPNIRHIDGRAYHFQDAYRSKQGADEAVEYYKKEGRLARSFKHFVKAHPLKGRHDEVIIPDTMWHEVYVTIKLRGKKS